MNEHFSQLQLSRSFATASGRFASERLSILALDWRSSSPQASPFGSCFESIHS